MEQLGKLLLIKPGEGRMTVFFMLLFICIGVSIAIAKGSADALFLKRYGVEHLAVVYLILAAVLAVVCTVYAAYVDRIASESFFRIIFVLQLGVLALSWLGMRMTELEFVYPVYYVLYSLSSELMLLHGAFYLGQNMDTLQSKRLTPLVLGGYQMGMIGGGLLLVFIAPVFGLDKAPLAWGLFSLLALVLLGIWHRKHGPSPYYLSEGKKSAQPHPLRDR